MPRAGRHRSTRATRRTLTAVAAAAAVALVVGAAVLVAPVVDTRDTPEWPGTAEATEPSRVGRGGVSPSAGPPVSPPTTAPKAAASTAVVDAGRTADTCGRCGDRATPPTTPANEKAAATEPFEAPLGEVTEPEPAAVEEKPQLLAPKPKPTRTANGRFAKAEP